MFVDEAYKLSQKSNTYGKEALDTILQEMTSRESHKRATRVTFIFAGYEHHMGIKRSEAETAWQWEDSFLQFNPGMASRIPNHIRFSPFTTRELAEMTWNMMTGQSTPPRPTHHSPSTSFSFQDPDTYRPSGGFMYKFNFNEDLHRPEESEEERQKNCVCERTRSINNPSS